MAKFMNPETVKKAYGLIVPNKLLKPIIISEAAIRRTITMARIIHEVWCLTLVYSILYFRRVIIKTVNARIAKNREVVGLIYVGWYEIRIVKLFDDSRPMKSWSTIMFRGMIPLPIT